MRESTVLGRRSRLPAALAVLALLAGCVTAPSLRNDTERGAPAASEQEPESAGTLAGTTWRLIAIRMMDGAVHRPRDGARYMVAFDADGAVSIRADCNRGSGTWSSGRPWQVRFGAIATTRALCPPGSISQRFLAQIPLVRSYVLERGHLFLATRARGAVIELAPAGDSTSNED